MRLTCKHTIYTQTHVQTTVIDDHQASARAACVLQLVGTTDSVTAQPYILLPASLHCSLVPRPRLKHQKRISVYFLLTITSQNCEEPIRLWNETVQNVILSHAHKAKSADMQYGKVAHDGVVCVSYTHVAVVSCLREIS